MAHGAHDRYDVIKYANELNHKRAQLDHYSRDLNKSTAPNKSTPWKKSKILTRALPPIRALPGKNQSLPVKIFYRQNTKRQSKTVILSQTVQSMSKNIDKKYKLYFV